ncbi:MAG: ribose-phosphate diphosphokinase [Gammaproteobacteria bacterium]|nr:ribose-phosphate diphosphokinase [Gammaproteobacteria bacterium]
MEAPDISLFTLNWGSEFASRVAAALGLPLSRHEEREFDDGEHKVRPLENVRGRDVFVVQSLHAEPGGSVNDKLCRLLFFIGALKDAAAARVTAVVPYLCYARKDRKTQSRDPVTTRYIARLFEGAGADRIVTVDVHNLAAYQNAFRCQTEHLQARGLFVGYFAQRVRDSSVAVVSPDVGGVKRAELFRQAMAGTLGRDVSAAFVEKQRALGKVTTGSLVGDVRGRIAIIVDDMIGSGTTIARAAAACRTAGAVAVFAAATHGLFVGNAQTVIAEAPVERVVVTDTVPPFRITAPAARARLEILDIAQLLAEAIRRMNSNESLVELDLA